MTKNQATQKHSFIKSEKYKVSDNISALRDQFKKNEILIFEKETYSIYDGITGYVFKDESGSLKVYDVPDSEKQPNLDKLFQRIKKYH